MERTNLPDLLASRRERNVRDNERLISTLLYLAGDVDRWKQAKDEGSRSLASYEEANIRARMRSIEEFLK